MSVGKLQPGDGFGHEVPLARRAKLFGGAAVGGGALQAAAKAGGPIMVTFSRGGGQFIAGKTASNEDDAGLPNGSAALREPVAHGGCGTGGVSSVVGACAAREVQISATWMRRE